MKKPAIIYQEIEFTIYSHAMITPPMEVEDYNRDDPAEVIYASARDFITDGRIEQGRKDLGGETAMNELGLCYEHGLGVPRCEDKAFEWISKAVENGAGACAEHNLARCYRKGIGTKVDKEKADEWDRIAAEHGWKKHTKSE